MASREDEIFNQGIDFGEPKDNDENYEDDEDDGSSNVAPLRSTGIPPRESKEEKHKRVEELRENLAVIFGNVNRRNAGEKFLMDMPELEKTQAGNPKLEKEDTNAIAEKLKEEAHDQECRYAKQWCAENAHLISIDVSQEQDPEVFYAWAKKAGAFEPKKEQIDPGTGRKDLPNWLDTDFAPFEKNIKRLEGIAGTIAAEHPPISSRFFALQELNKKANDVGDTIEALDITQNADLKQIKEKEWSDLFDLRKKLYESIKGNNSLEEQIAQKTKDISDPDEVKKETNRVYDVAFNELTASKDNLLEMYREAYKAKKEDLLKAEPSDKSAQQKEAIDAKYAGQGVDLAKVPSTVVAQMTDAEKKAVGLPEGLRQSTTLEKFSEAAPSYALMVLMALSGIWMIGAFKEILSLAWEIGTTGWPRSLQGKVERSINSLIKAVNP